jgi:hypothetical protein
MYLFPLSLPFFTSIFEFSIVEIAGINSVPQKTDLESAKFVHHEAGSLKIGVSNSKFMDL